MRMAYYIEHNAFITICVLLCVVDFASLLVYDIIKFVSLCVVALENTM